MPLFLFVHIYTYSVISENISRPLATNYLRIKYYITNVCYLPAISTVLQVSGFVECPLHVWVKSAELVANGDGRQTINVMTYSLSVQQLCVTKGL